MTNSEVAAAMKDHHASMVREARRLLDSLASNRTRWESARHDVVSYWQHEVFPHAEAEEQTIYATSQTFDALGVLVESMVSEHEVLREWFDALKNATAWIVALRTATAMTALFEIHATKENQFLIDWLTLHTDVNMETVLGALKSRLAHPSS